eukprot:evm.model.scf_412.9 EVM.evm.TU.scf_412.9   scf_412:77305-81810(-)
MSAEGPRRATSMRRSLSRLWSIGSTRDAIYDTSDALVHGSSSKKQDIPWIVSQMEEEDVDRQELAAVLLAELVAADKSVIDAFIRENGLAPLIDILEGGTDRAKERATKVVAAIAGSREWGDAFVDAGGVEVLVGRPLRSKNAVRRRLALAATLELMERAPIEGGKDKGVVGQVAAFDGILPLVNLAGSGDREERRKAAKAIGILSEGKAPIPAMVAISGGVKVMLRLSEARGDAERKMAARALARFSDMRESQDELVAQGGVPPLLRLLGDAEEECRAKAALALANLSMRGRGRRAMGRCGAVDELVEALEGFERWPGVVAMAGCALCNLAQDEGNREAMVERGAVSLLLRILDESDDGAQKVALAALGNLARSKGPRGAIVGADGGIALALIVEKLADTDPVKAQRAARALSNLAISKTAHEGIVEAGAIRHLAGLLQSGWGEMRRVVAGCLASLAVNLECKKDIADYGVIPGLVAMLTGEHAEQAAFAIATLLDGIEVLSADVTDRIIASVAADEGIPRLSLLLASKSGYSSLHAARAIASLSDSTTAIRMEVGCSGAVANLAGLLVEDNTDLRYSAVRALAGLSRVEENREAIGESGCVRWLIHLMHTGDDKVRKLAASTLSNVTFLYGVDQWRQQATLAGPSGQSDKGCSEAVVPACGTVEVANVQGMSTPVMVAEGHVGQAEGESEDGSPSAQGGSGAPVVAIGTWFRERNGGSVLGPAELDSLRRLPDRLLQAIAVEIGSGPAQSN